MAKRVILAIDIGNTTGMVLGSRPDSLEFVRFNFAPKGKFDAALLKDFGEEIQRIIKKHGKALDVVIEKPHAGRFFNSVKNLFAMMGQVSMLCAIHNVPSCTYSPASVKKFWTGKGNAKKPEMVAVTTSLYPDEICKDHNISDAIALWHYHYRGQV